MDTIETESANICLTDSQKEVLHDGILNEVAILV
ncbi:MAG: hypothetical protein K0R05_3541 [Anaerocolumna sp.]|jgi:hypothetical protein|nr:hypothetical protein [Anaerocolumna sp.]